MKISILTDNFAGPGFLAEHGLSYLVQHNDFKFLFDTGSTDVFIKNAVKMNLSIDDIDTVILSHGHWDHGDGLNYINNKRLITHPDSFIKRFRRSNNESLGLNLSLDEASARFDIIKTKEPYWLTNEIVFLGQIERQFLFEKWQTPYVDEFGSDDFINDDSAVVIISDEGLNIVTGCSHSGICNIIEYAKKVTGEDKVNSVTGGFHLKNNDSRTQKTIEYFKKNKIQIINPSHCTQLPALAEFYKEFNIRQIKTGITFSL